MKWSGITIRSSTRSQRFLIVIPSDGNDSTDAASEPGNRSEGGIGHIRRRPSARGAPRPLTQDTRSCEVDPIAAAIR